MLLKNIKIKNYGCIKDFNYVFRKNGNRNVPLILFGQNGSGKSLVLSNIVDAIIEIKRREYPQEIIEVKDNNYFRIGNKNYIRSGANLAEVKIEFDNGSKYLDLMSTQPKLYEEKYKNNELIDMLKFKKSGYSRTAKSPDNTNFENDCYLYFPIDRFYIPIWQNRINYNKFIEKDFQKNVGKSSTNIIKNDISENIRQWLYNLFGIRVIVPISNNTIRLHDDVVQSYISTVLQVILGNDATILPVSRKMPNQIPIKVNNLRLNDINALSSGEMMLFSIFISIIKEYDLNHSDYKLEDISGVCIIDEVDLNLHVHQQEHILPRLISLFPKVQFIITTHSPFFAKGIYSLLKSEIDLVNMPSGIIQNNLENLKEIQDAIKIFEEDGKKILQELENIKEKLSEIQKDKIIILVEGKTDKKLLEKAANRLNYDLSNIEIVANKDAGGDQRMRDFLVNNAEYIGDNSRKIIAIFDRDNNDIIKWFGSDAIKEIIPNKAYAFCIPIPPSRNSEDHISIEHYFLDNEIRTFDSNNKRLYQVGEFQQTGIHASNTKMCKYLVFNYNKHDKNYVLSGSYTQKVTDLSGTTVLSLSKNEFCNYVANDIKPFDAFDFLNFKMIFNLIDECKTKM